MCVRNEVEQKIVEIREGFWIFLYTYAHMHDGLKMAYACWYSLKSYTHAVIHESDQMEQKI